MSSLEEALASATVGDAARIKAIVAPYLPELMRSLKERGRVVRISLVATSPLTIPTANEVLGLVRLHRSNGIDRLEFFYVLSSIELHIYSKTAPQGELGETISYLADMDITEEDLACAEELLSQLAA